MEHRHDRPFTSRPRLAVSVAIVVASSVLAASSADDASTSAATDTVAVTVPASEGASVTTPGSTPDIDPGLQPYIDIAVADLAARLQRQPGDITTRSAVLTSWPAATIGGAGTVTVGWAGLQPGLQYLGAVSHQDATGEIGITLVTVDS